MGGNGPMSFESASLRWWEEVAQFRGDADDLLSYLIWLKTKIGAKTLLSHIDDEKVSDLVGKRRADGVSNRTVNATVIDVLRPIIRRARKTWKADTADVDWKEHRLKEASIIEREASIDEETRLLNATRDDYRDMFRFDFLSGLRLAELVDMRWSRIDLTSRRKRLGILGKGGKVKSIPLTRAMIAILLRQPRMPGQDFVWSYVPQRKSGDRHVVIERSPITYQGAKTQWRRARDRAGIVSRAVDPVAGFRLHDIRHTALTRLARTKGGLLAAQKLGRHDDIQTTRRYAFATEDDLLEAMEEAQSETVSPLEIPHEETQKTDKAMKRKGKP